MPTAISPHPLDDAGGLVPPRSRPVPVSPVVPFRCENRPEAVKLHDRWASGRAAGREGGKHASSVSMPLWRAASTDTAMLYRRGMRPGRLLTALAVAIGLLTSSGCTPPDPEPTPTSDTTIAAPPLFTTEEEALAAAEAAYAEYTRVLNEVGQAGWKDLAPLETVLVGDELASFRESAADAQSKGWRQVGEAKFDSVSIQFFEPRPSAVTVYLCEDTSGVDIVDAQGTSVMAVEGLDRTPLEVEFSEDRGVLKVARDDTWTGDSFC